MRQKLRNDRPAGPGSYAEAAAEVTYYTDPLCCWSWAFEPQWRRLRYEYGSHIGWRYRLRSRVPAGAHTPGPCRAETMRRLWDAVRRVSGMPFDPSLWTTDPPASAAPARVAFEAAARQSAEAADRYLRLLREAAMLGRRNPARRTVLLSLADTLAAEAPHAFDAARFRRDLDAQEIFGGILDGDRPAAFPSTPALLFRGPDGTARLLAGYHPYAVVEATLRQIAPGLPPPQRAFDAEAYAAFWGRITGREIAEAVSPQAARGTTPQTAPIPPRPAPHAEERLRRIV